jgi:hypothetical protein
MYNPAAFALHGIVCGEGLREITPVSKIGSHCFEIADLTRTVMDDYYKLCVAVDPDNFHI